MRIIIFDTFHVFKEKELEKLSSIGIKEILTFDLWIENEPTKGKYNFDRIIEYEKLCNKFGIKVLLMGPIFPPFWVPKNWYLKNDLGEYSNYNEKEKEMVKILLSKIKSGENIEWYLTTTYPAKILCYWNPSAEKYLRRYIKKIQKVLKNSEHLCCIGNYGEYFFPSSVYFTDKKQTPWWNDRYAEKSWKKSRLSREEWFHKEFLRITKERLELYKTKWLEYCPEEYFYHKEEFDKYKFNEENLKLLGNNHVEEAIDQNKDNLNRIIFSVFADIKFIALAAKLTKKCKIFAGAEGSENIIVNFLRSEKIGISGLVCNPCLPSHYQPIKKNQYSNIKCAIWLNKKGFFRIIALTTYHLKIVGSKFFAIIKRLNI